ncbi:MAG: CCA tRNA nucleotidyltransferase, partial [Bacteroidales bacterium]|nr:CCA tRNA nucleotidyltransferase [Bacteroidales bacterium]
MNIASKIDRKIFRHVGSVADGLNRECYVVGGYVRDLFLDRHSKDIDFVTVGNGIEVAEAVTASLGRGAHLAVYKNFGTASIHYRGEEIEFVGARKESYRRDSRKPIVEDGTLDDDLSRRDLTINAMAIAVNNDRFGQLIDKFNGLEDLEAGLIRTPLDPDVTFSDDPLRMMRAIRFATQLQFTIVPETLASIRRNAHRLEIISRERVYDELTKIMNSSRPSIGWRLLS